jgi:hypothetical protein
MRFEEPAALLAWRRMRRSGEAALRENGAVAEERHGLLRELFGESDLVKFAALVPPGDAPGRALERCRSFVRETAMEVEHAL